MPERLLTTDEVAALLRVHPKHVYRLLKRGLPGRKVGGEWRFVEAEVLAWPGAAPAATDSRPSAGDRPPIVAANGDVALELLLELANRRGPPLVGFVRVDREGALALLAQGAVLAAGCHGAGFPPRLGEARLARLHLVRREVGLAVREGPVPELGQLHRLRFAGRPPTAGVVVHFERALAEAGARKPRGTALGSHRDVAGAVLRGEADVGLMTSAWAHWSGLTFRALASEDYGLVVRALDLGRPEFVRLCEVAQGGDFRGRLRELPGYDPTDAGAIRYDAA
jgi:putative molybdopterin biosynthesis protein